MTNNIAKDIAESIELTKEAVQNELFCIELATVMCAPSSCGSMDVAQCVTDADKIVLVKYLRSGGKIHTCVDHGKVEVRVLDGDGNMVKSIVPECQSALRNAVNAYIKQVKELKRNEVGDTMRRVSEELVAEVGALTAGPAAADSGNDTCNTFKGALKDALLAAIAGGAAKAEKAKKTVKAKKDVKDKAKKAKKTSKKSK